MKYQTERKEILVIITMAQSGLINVNVLMRLYIFLNIPIFNMSKVWCTETYNNGQGTGKIQSCPRYPTRLGEKEALRSWRKLAILRYFWNFLLTFTIRSQNSSILQEDQTEAIVMYAVLSHETSRRLRNRREYDVEINLLKNKSWEH